MAQFHKHFTLEQACNLVPWVNSIFQKIHALMRAMEEASRQAATPLPPTDSMPQPLTPLNQASIIDLEQLWSVRSRAEQSQLFESLIECLTEEGLLIFDLQCGSVHFPSFYHGDEILLCYSLQDGPCIEHWHAVDETCRMRKPTRGFLFGAPTGDDIS